jgi:DNA helicase-2/ATP-dependent DNA helicase PcrA
VTGSGSPATVEHVYDDRWDAGLDEQQLAAVVHGTDPLVVLAGAGTGKTRTLTSRVASLLESGTPPERVLLLTFTRRAAEDMLARVATICGDSTAASQIWGGTFHAVAHRLIAEHCGNLGLSTVSVIDPGDVADLMDLMRDEHGLTATDSRVRMPRASTLADLYSRSINTGRAAREVIQTDYPWCEPHTDAIMGLLRAFVARKRDRGLLDFDDLLLTWRALLDSPATGDRLRQRWDHVLVDEFQDVNQIQVDIVSRLRTDGEGLTVVGDDAQAVYGFRGAASGHLLDLARSLPKARTIKLETNFRSRQPLLELANRIRPGDGEDRLVLRAARTDQPDGSLHPSTQTSNHSSTQRAQRPRLVRCYDAPDEARQVADALLQSLELGGRLRDHAVLMRASHHSDLLELELTSRRIPFVKYGGLKFLEAAHVKDFLATLRVLDNPRDEVAWFRLLRLHRGVGPASAGAMLKLLLTDHRDLNAVVAAAPGPARTRLADTLHQLDAARRPMTTNQQVSGCLHLLKPLLQQRYADSAVRIGDVERLAEAATRAADLASFVAEVTLDPPQSTGDYAKPPHLEEDFVTLSTVHSAKGLEWLSVHVIHAVDGSFPSDMALTTTEGLAEESRLFYVAATRARDELSVYTPLRMPHHRRVRDDRHSFAPQSRFLTEDAVAVMDVCQRPRRTAALVGPAETAPSVAIPTLESLFD